MGGKGCAAVRTSVGKVLVVLLRARLGLLEVLVLDLDKLDHFGGCVGVCAESGRVFGGLVFGGFVVGEAKARA